MAKKISDYIPILKDQGIDYVAAAPVAGVSTQYQVVNISGNPQTIELEHDMADTNYAVVVDVSVGNSQQIDNKTTTSFRYTPGASGYIGELNVIIVGQLKGQK